MFRWYDPASWSGLIGMPGETVNNNKKDTTMDKMELPGKLSPAQTLHALADEFAAAAGKAYAEHRDSSANDLRDAATKLRQLAKELPPLDASKSVSYR